MTYFDRYYSQIIANLPIHLDLGRIAVIEDDVVRDLTNVDAAKAGEYVVRESLFDESNDNIHSLLRTIAIRYDNDVTNSRPITQEYDVKLNDFEKELLKHIHHLKSILKRPHYLLIKNVMKVNIGRAKRISTRSYQHLACHSEDWEKMTILSPKPRKILHEELEIDFAVYENLLLKAFLHNTIKRLNQRIKGSGDIIKFFSQIFVARLICPECGFVYEYSAEDKSAPVNCPNCKKKINEWIEEGATIWSGTINRRDALIGQSVNSAQLKSASDTNESLIALRSELVKMEHGRLFDDFPRMATDSIVLHDTNVLNSHKHYKYLKELWVKLISSKPQAKDQDVVVEHQLVMNDMRAYVESLFVYALRHMGFTITGLKGEIIAESDSFPGISITSDKYGILQISTSLVKLQIITLGGIYSLSEERKLPQNTICFCFADYQAMPENIDGVYFVNPIDPNSVENAGTVIRKLIIKDYLETVNKKVSFNKGLRDFLCLISCDNLTFDLDEYTYSFEKNLPERFDPKFVISKLRDLAGFKRRNNQDQERIKRDMSELVRSVNEHIAILEQKHRCPYCTTPYRKKDLRFMVCDCGFVCNVTGGMTNFYHNQKDKEFSMISAKGWGMDYVH